MKDKKRMVFVVLTTCVAFGGFAGTRFADWKERLPKPVYDADPRLVDFYFKAWEMAHDRIDEIPGIPAPRYMDEAHLAAFVRRSAEAGDLPVRITVDGSTYWKVRSVDFDCTVRKGLAALAPGIPFDIFRTDDAPMVGAAVAAWHRTLNGGRQ